ncbi:MAG: tRNA (adenosine(37)-N6)-threonylcarbamoyltransferase complex dimerization subunit type 1 TsaB [Endomicrobia bacterium]|nr:tRNA (adenosine(37)-N6)-threonylcarbamoyltransferase complex dimerization subunit type 1 TsaB [Endomicrobiia bacterium]
MKKHKILSVDTSTTNLSMCLYKEKKFYLVNTLNKDHSEYLVLSLDKILKKSKTNLKDISYLCINTGPGSFTGLRIGLSFIRTIAKHLNIKVVVTTSFDILLYEYIKSHRLEEDVNVVTLFPSLKNEVYFCKYNIKKYVINKTEIGFRIVDHMSSNIDFEREIIVIPKSLEISFVNNAKIFRVRYSSKSIIEMFIQRKENLYKIVKEECLTPLYIRHTYY